MKGTWQALGTIKTNWQLGSKKQNVTIGDPNLINDYFASVASDPNYYSEAVIGLQALIKDINFANDNYSQGTIELLLVHIVRTSPGNDDTHYWLYRDCASELAGVVSK